MKRLTYKEAYDKIIEAYFKDEIKPLDDRFCFCGTLSNQRKWWDQHNDSETYTEDEFHKMEKALFSAFPLFTWAPGLFTEYHGKDAKPKDYIMNNEDLLFKGMCAALEVLKEIHRSRGENVDEEVVPFTKRNLKPVNV